MFDNELEWINSQKEIMVALVTKWSHINSFTTNLLGLQQMLSVLKEEFCALEGKMQEIALPPKKSIDSNGQLVEQPLGKALHISKRPEAPLKIFLGGHMDTVFPPHANFQKTERQSPHILKGPGVADMKGGLVIMLIALRALEASSYAQNIGWEILINPDEEIGSPGSKSLFEAAAAKHHLGLLFEPSLPDGSLINRRGGSASFTLVARGKSAHVGRDFALGRNAIHAISHWMYEVQQAKDIGYGIIFNVGNIEGGGAVNVVPEIAICRFNIRMQQMEQWHQFETNLKQIMQKCKQLHEVDFQLHQHSFNPPKPFDAKTKQAFEMLRECAATLDLPIQWRESGGVCDGNTLANKGLPTIDTLGVCGDKIHTEEEFLIIDSLIQRAKLTALFLFKLATKEIQLH